MNRNHETMVAASGLRYDRAETGMASHVVIGEEIA